MNKARFKLRTLYTLNNTLPWDVLLTNDTAKDLRYTSIDLNDNSSLTEKRMPTVIV